MLRRTLGRHSWKDLYRDLNRTTKAEATQIQRNGVKEENWIMRWIFRRRWIDGLAKRIHEHDRFDLHPSFYSVLIGLDGLLVLPPFFLICCGYWNPLRYVVSLGIMGEEEFNKGVDSCPQGLVYASQLIAFLWWWDASVYLRYPFLDKVVIPLYKRQGWIRRPDIAGSNPIFSQKSSWRVPKADGTDTVAASTSASGAAGGAKGKSEPGGRVKLPGFRAPGPRTRSSGFKAKNGGGAPQ